MQAFVKCCPATTFLSTQIAITFRSRRQGSRSHWAVLNFRTLNRSCSSRYRPRCSLLAAWTSHRNLRFLLPENTSTVSLYPPLLRPRPIVTLYTRAGLSWVWRHKGSPNFLSASTFLDYPLFISYSTSIGVLQRLNLQQHATYLRKTTNRHNARSPSSYKLTPHISLYSELFPELLAIRDI